MSKRMEDLAGADVNPLKSDPELLNLLKRLDGIKKYKSFQRWKSKFLDRLEQFLYEDGMKPAEKASDDFTAKVKKFVKAATKVEDFIEKGELNDNKKTVKAALALSEMCNQLTTLVSDVENLIPSKSQEEKKCGFTKFHLGAVLIRQGFHQYVTMQAIEHALTRIGTTLEHVADRQQHDLFVAYKKQVQRFCDIMADLNLYEVMLKCIQFLEAPEEEESSSEEPVTVQITVKCDDGKVMTLILDPTETIGNIKDAIAPDSGIKPDRQVLKFGGNKLDDNAKTLEQLGIEDGAELTLEPFRVPVTVNTMDGKSIEFMVDPTDYLSDVKKHLEGESGIPAKNQCLMMNGDELADAMKTAEDYGIKAGSVLDLEPKSIKISVETPGGKKHEVEINPSDTTETIKAKVEETTSMPASKQVLKLNGKALEDGKTAKEQGVQNGSEIKAEVYKVPITVNTMDGKSIKAMVDPTDYLPDIKKQLENESGVPAKNQRLFMDGDELADDKKKASDYGIKPGSVLDLEPKVIKVNVTTPDGKKHNIEINLKDKTEDIKAKIAKVSGLTVPQQVLKFNDKECPDGKTVKDLGIQEGSDLTVDIFKVPITVNTMDGKSIKAMVDPTNKMSAIKKQLEDESGLPASNQKLFMDGEELVDDNKKASDYGIKPGSILDLEPRMIKVSVTTPDGKNHSIEISSKDKTEGIKAKIAKVSGLTVPQQVLKFNGKECPNGKPVKDLGIQDGSDLTVDIFKVPITVKTMDGKSIKVMVDPTEKMSEIKKQLADESGIPPKNQKLFLNGNELVDDSKSATDYGVKKGSVLDLEPKTIKVSVKMPDGKIQEVEVKPSDTAEAVKDKIAKATGFAAPRQVLKYNGKEMPNGNTVRDMGITEGSTLDVGIFKIPITVKTYDGKSVSLKVEPCDTIDNIKKLLQPDVGLEPKKQALKFGEEELKDGRATADSCGIKKGSELFMDIAMDAIIFVDIKCGTLFAMDRDDVIAKGALTPHQNNKLDFSEAARDSTTKDQILQYMKESPNLGVSPQVVVTKMDVEDYELEEAEAVKSMWGVDLKKREKNKKGEEFLFVDPKTGACGELSRKKYLDMKFITPTTGRKGETLVEAETDSLMYDKCIADIRKVFGIKSAK
jgi:ubiquitin C